MARGMHKGPRGEKKQLEQTNLGKRQAAFESTNQSALKTTTHKPGSRKK
jgi:hypothetical protein